MSSLAKPVPGAKLVRKGKVSGHSGMDQHGGLGHISSGRVVSNKGSVGGKLVRGGKAPGVGAKSPKVGMGANPFAKGFSHPDSGIPQIKGGGGKGGRC